jgi:hypothetical protein
LVRVDQLASGCDVKENWTGYIRKAGDYIWDTR